MIKTFTTALIILMVTASALWAVSTEKDACTTITVGKNATFDGSVITTHTCDSRVDRTWIEIVPAQKHKKGTMRKVYADTHRTVSALDRSKQTLKGEIPQAAETYKYLNTTLPAINEHQVAVGEATFTGKKIMQSDNGIIDYYELNRLMLERGKTAREAIKIACALAEEYGYNDGGECFTVADPKEVWHLEIIGPGKGKKGAVWVAQRVPDDHVSVNANASRIRQIDLNQPDVFMASENYMSRAVELGLYDPNSGKPFEFCYAYADRTSMAARRREWRVFNLLAPSMPLDPNDENYPFSIKPEKKVTPQDIMRIYADTFEGTPFDMTKFMIVPELDDHYEMTGKYKISDYANPFMHYDMMPLFKINGGWNHLGERCIARYYCTYATIIQARGWLPNDVGGLVWFGYDNPAMMTYAPIYIGAEDVPQSYKICGRPGFNRDCAWWAFNRVADLSAQKWGAMRIDVDNVRLPLQKEIMDKQKETETQALTLLKKNPKKARQFLTQYTDNWLTHMEKTYWKLGDDLWSKYTGKF